MRRSTSTQHTRARQEIRRRKIMEERERYNEILGSWCTFCVTVDPGKAPHLSVVGPQQRRRQGCPGCHLADAGARHSGEEARWRSSGPVETL